MQSTPSPKALCIFWCLQPGIPPLAENLRVTIGSAALAQLPWNGVSDLLGALGPRALAISPWSFVSACFLNVMDLFKKTTLREIQVQKRELYLVKDTI